MNMMTDISEREMVTVEGGAIGILAGCLIAGGGILIGMGISYLTSDMVRPDSDLLEKFRDRCR